MSDHDTPFALTHRCSYQNSLVVVAVIVVHTFLRSSSRVDQNAPRISEGAPLSTSRLSTASCGIQQQRYSRLFSLRRADEDTRSSRTSHRASNSAPISIPGPKSTKKLLPPQHHLGSDCPHHLSSDLLFWQRIRHDFSRWTTKISLPNKPPQPPPAAKHNKAKTPFRLLSKKC